MGKKKLPGHYCKICGERKANEKFSGKGHVVHTCKKCQSLPAEVQTDMRRIRDVERIFGKYPLSRPDWELLEKYSQKYADKESGQFAQSILDNLRAKPSYDEDGEEKHEEQSYTEFDNDEKVEIEEIIYDEVYSFILRHEYIPEKRHQLKITDKVCRLIQQEYGICLKPDEPFESKVNEIIRTVTEDLESDGEKISTYADSLILLETERLLLRKFDKDDLPALHTIMEKPEVMYAWEHGFTKNDIRKWLNRQLTRYHKDGFGYFAVILKENGYLIGQVGLLKSEIDGKEVIELGYIFNNDYWHQGYCMEAANACIRHAFSMLNADALYCSIRPENLPSVRVAEKLGMVKVGEHAVIYREKEMPHLILKKDNK